MATKHSPRIALDNARRDLTFAEQACAHWDYEDNPHGDDHDCCRDLRAAVQKRDDARDRVRKSEAGRHV